MHKPAQVELQLDRPQLPYSEILGPIIVGGSPTHYRRRQPNPAKKGPYTYIYIFSKKKLHIYIKGLEHPYQYMQKLFHFAHLKPNFFILHIYFYKTPTLICLLYTFIQIKYSFI